MKAVTSVPARGEWPMAERPSTPEFAASPRPGDFAKTKQPNTDRSAWRAYSHGWSATSARPVGPIRSCRRTVLSRAISTSAFASSRMALAAASPAAGRTTVALDAHDGHPYWEDELSQRWRRRVVKDQEFGRVPTRSCRRDDRAVAVGSTVVPCDGPSVTVCWYWSGAGRSSCVAVRWWREPSPSSGRTRPG
jgi:hypothetical protein